MSDVTTQQAKDAYEKIKAAAVAAGKADLFPAGETVEMSTPSESDSVTIAV